MVNVRLQARCIAIVPAAGVGQRFGADRPKQYLEVAGTELIVHTVGRLLSCAEIDEVRVVLAPDDGFWDALGLTEKVSTWLVQRDIAMTRCDPSCLKIVYVGGASRAETVKNALSSADIAAHDRVLVHDAARCCISNAALRRLLGVSLDEHGALLALPVADTVKRGDEQRRIVETLPREHMWLAQTPQIFFADVLRRALHTVSADMTDEASAVESLGLRPSLVLGDRRNIKVTYPDDLALVADCLQRDELYRVMR